MKQILYLLMLMPLFAFAKELPTPSTIKKVTVFINGGQITREANTPLPIGKTEVVIDGLSKYLDPKSIRVKGIGDFTILATRNQIDFFDKKKSANDDLWRKQLKDLDQQIKILSLEYQTLTEKQNFLKENRKITNTNTPLSFSDFKQYYALYGEQMEQITQRKNEIDIQSQQLNANKQDLLNQIREVADKERKGFYKIIITVQAKRATTAKFEINYYVSNCSWFPTYDIRVNSLKEPVNLSYKANLKQMTGVDWKNVLLTFSNATPTDVGVVPVLRPFYLGEYNRRQNSTIRRVSGRVTSVSGEPLYGASIIISGTSIGTTTDANGQYEISVPTGNHSLEVSYVGYSSSSHPISSSTMNIVLEEGHELSEVVVTSSAMQIYDNTAGKSYRRKSSKRKKHKQASKPIKMDLTTNTTSIEFEIKEPYTILSKPKSQSIEMRNFEMPSSYEYQIVPKIETAAYLMAYITDWEQYHLLDGESNLYFENTYVGKALIEATSVKDTLQLSLGKDKSIAVTRTKIKDHSKKQLIGGKKVIKKAWKIEVKNNKSVAINVLVFDQIPISRKEKIEVSNIQYGSAKYDNITGEVQWQAQIPAHNKDTYRLSYTVKYPKAWAIQVE